EKLNANGLDGILSQAQIDRLVEIFNQLKDSGIFTGEEAQKLVNSSEDLINRITSSDAFKDAKESTTALGKDMAESKEVNSVMDAIHELRDRIVEFFKGLF